VTLSLWSDLVDDDWQQLGGQQSTSTLLASCQHLLREACASKEPLSFRKIEKLPRKSQGHNRSNQMLTPACVADIGAVTLETLKKFDIPHE
jgi:hypothetical protein